MKRERDESEDRSTRVSWPYSILRQCQDGWDERSRRDNVQWGPCRKERDFWLICPCEKFASMDRWECRMERPWRMFHWWCQVTEESDGDASMFPWPQRCRNPLGRWSECLGWEEESVMNKTKKRFTFVGGHIILNSHMNIFIVELQSAFSQLTDDVLLKTTTTRSKGNDDSVRETRLAYRLGTQHHLYWRKAPFSSSSRTWKRGDFMRGKLNLVESCSWSMEWRKSPKCRPATRRILS